jgi:hypothetical protein
MIFFYSCNELDRNHKRHIEFNPAEVNISRDSLFNEDYYSYYGIVVENSDERNFYCIDKDIMLKYFANFQDTNQLKNDLNKAKWHAELRGRSYDCFAFAHFLDTDTLTIILNYCDKERKSKVIPVYLTEFTYSIQTKLNELGACEGKIIPLPFKTFSRAGLNVVYIAPLQADLRNKFLDVKDTLNKDSYLKYIEYYH